MRRMSYSNLGVFLRSSTVYKCGIPSRPSLRHPSIYTPSMDAPFILVSFARPNLAGNTASGVFLFVFTFRAALRCLSQLFHRNRPLRTKTSPSEARSVRCRMGTMEGSNEEARNASLPWVEKLYVTKGRGSDGTVWNERLTPTTTDV